VDSLGGWCSVGERLVLKKKGKGKVTPGILRDGGECGSLKVGRSRSGRAAKRKTPGNVRAPFSTGEIKREKRSNFAMIGAFKLQSGWAR